MINLCFSVAIGALVIVVYKYLLQYSVVKSWYGGASLSTIGVVHKNALKKGNKTLRLDKQEYIFNSFIFFSLFSWIN